MRRIQRFGAHRLATLVEPMIGRGDGPVYDRLAHALRQALVDGRLPSGTRLPSERELTDRLGLSRTTVTRAYGQLRDQGYVMTRRGSGSVIVLPQVPGGRVDHLLTPSALEGDSLDLTCTAQPAPTGTGEAFRRAVEELPRYLPGTGYYPSGLAILRERIAEAYASRGLPTDPDQIIVTPGALGGLSVSLGAVVGRGDGVLVESPTYANAIAAIEGAGGRLLAHPIDHLTSDWDVPGLGGVLAGHRVRAAYLIPDFHNPTGALMSSGQRGEVAAVLRSRGVTPIVDESLVDLAIDDDVLPMPAPFARSAPSAVTVGSASKLLWGGLRIGWVRAPRALVAQVATSRLRQDLGAPVLEQLATAYLLERRDEIVAERRAQLRSSRDALLAGLATHLPTWRVRAPAGGMALWCALPEQGSTALVVAARRYGIALAAGPNFAPRGGLDGWVRLPYSLPAGQIELVPERLAQAWDDVTSGRVRAEAATDRRIIA
ncbi:PLP-dependent aminotransferase family protein [Nostocoides sp. F2B08]|uniref:MocR-like transcription factor YczR n=1 Tax=Nostocoides sp. F2B08 TaxID=2653936 RepID=UPI001D03C788|nr:PLP-dependent aminotransferase family protein [Tetrasphaera sp. F2B08]